MNHREIAALMAELAPVIHDYVADGLKGLGERIAAVEARAPIAGERGADGSAGIDGKDGAPGRDGVDGTAGAPGLDGLAGAPGLDGAPGRDGVDGKDGAPGDKGDPGIDGKDGASGRDGIDGKDADPAVVKLAVAEEIAKIPPAANGKDGRDGQPGVPGRDGKDGAPGANGKDGLGFDDLEQFEDEESYGLKFSRDGQQVKELRWKKPTLADSYVGVWKDGNYGRGKVATLDGSQFLAMRDTATRPGTPDSDWKLVVKRGRDGKEGRPGDRGLQGAKGDVGERGPPGYRG